MTTQAHPVRIVVTDDLRRSRWTVFFRAFLAIPHYFWAFLIGSAVAFAVFANWWILLVKGQTPRGLHDFVGGYLRYVTQLEAYFLLAANPYPGFFLIGEKPYPVDLEIAPPEPQSRWKTFFRLVLAIPAFMIAGTLLWGGPRSGSYFSGGLAFAAAFLLWWVAIFKARVPRGMRDLVVYCLAYGAQVSAYVFLLTDRYPFSGPKAFFGEGDAVGEPAPPPVWLFDSSRVEGQVLVLLLVARDAEGRIAARRAVRIPAEPARDDLVAGSPVPADVLQLAGVLPAAAPPAETLDGPETPAHPVRLTVDDDLRRSRVLVFFRLPVAIPHVVWLILWSILVAVVLLLTWVCALVIGRPPRPFHRFLSAYVRYTTHLFAFVFLVANPFPGFVGKAGTYPVDLELPPPGPQRRVVTFFRLLLAIPAFILSGAISSALCAVGFLGWFVALFRGRMPDGLQNLGAYAIRYAEQVNAYVYLLTERYPDSGPRADPASP